MSFKFSEGYFLSKLITFEIVFIKVLFKNFFISWKNLVPCFRYSIFLNILILFILAIIQFCIFLPIPSTSNFVVSWWVLSCNVEFIFEYIFRFLNHLVMKLEQLIDLVMDKVFRNILLDWEEWVLNTAPFWLSNLSQLIKTQLSLVCVFFSPFKLVHQVSQKE